MYCLSFLYTRESKLRVFQFKFLDRKIAPNDFLYKIGIKERVSCSFCEEQKENLVHLFSIHTQNFWKSIFEWISQNFKDLEKVSLFISLHTLQKSKKQNKSTKIIYIIDKVVREP